MLVILFKLIDKYCPKKCTPVDLQPQNLLQIFISLECAVLLPLLIYYLGKSIYFSLVKF